MKNLRLTVSLIFSIMVFNAFSQETLVIVADSTNCADANLSYYYADKNYGYQTSFRAGAWTYSGSYEYVRALLSFDLSALPAIESIESATLSLYHSTEMEHQPLSGSNACYIQRVTQYWNEEAVTWNTQPTSTTESQVEIQQSTSNDEDFESIDVTPLLKDMIAKPDSSFGFMIRLQNESYYRRMVFSSSECADTSLRPKLTLTYMPKQCTCADTVIVYDTIKVSVTDTLFIDITLSALDKNSKETIKVYPNPTKDMVSIDFSNFENMSAYSIKIIDIKAQVIFETLANEKHKEVSLGQFGSNGLYFLQLFDSEQNLVDIRKIVLQ